jgi:hypothetical protein
MSNFRNTIEFDYIEWIIKNVIMIVIHYTSLSVINRSKWTPPERINNKARMKNTFKIANSKYNVHIVIVWKF